MAEMARIPRSDPTVNLAMADQPAMSSDALTGPGRALQGLGRAIAGLQGAFEAEAEPSEQDSFNAQMTEIQAYNDAAAYVDERKASLTGDMDPTEWRNETMAGVGDIYGNRRAEVPNYPKLQQRFDLNAERFRGSWDRETHGIASKTTIQRNVDGAATTFTTTIGRHAADDPNFAAVLDTIDAQIGRIPGATPEQQAAVRRAAAEAAAAKLLENASSDPESAAGAAETVVDTWSRELQAPAPAPGELPRQGLPGSQSGPGQVRPQSNVIIGPVKGDGMAVVTSGSGARVRVSGDYADRFAGLISDLEAKGLEIDARQTGGYANRNIAGTKTKSRHASGEAVDINWTENARGKAGKIREIVPPEELNALTAKWGLKWGGNWKNPDDMHFEVDRTAKPKQRFAEASQPPSDAAKFELTAYSPRKAGDAMEGGYAAAKPGPDGKAEVRTLADVAAGRSEYVTIAGNPRDYGKTFTIPKITFVDGKGQRKTLSNVTAVVHDTGAAFKNAPEGRFDLPIDRDATDRQMATSHSMWKKDGVELVAKDAPPPVSERGITQYAGMQKPVQVADSSGAVPASVIADQVKGRVGADDGQPERPENTIPVADGMSPGEWSRATRADQDAAKPGSIPGTETSGGVSGQWVRPSIRSEVVDRLRKEMPALAEKRKKHLEQLQGAMKVSQFMTGEVPFNPYSDADRKLVDDTFKMGDLDKRLFAGDPDAMLRTVEVVQRLNYAPQVVTEALTGLVRSTDEKDAAKRAVGYEAAASILSRNPNAFAATEGGKSLATEAADYAALVRSGKSRDAAMLRLDEMKSPEWQTKLKARKEAVDELGKGVTVSDITDYFDPSSLPFNEPTAQQADLLRSDFVESFKEHYVRTGDEATAKALAAGDLKKVYGVSNISSDAQVMMYPPDAHYPVIGKDQAYLRDDLVATVKNWVSAGNPAAKDLEIDPRSIRLMPDGRTAGEIAARKPPSYQVMYRDDNGLMQLMPGRWGFTAEQLLAAQKKLEDADLEKRKAQGSVEKFMDQIQKAPANSLSRGKSRDILDYLQGQGAIMNPAGK